MSNLLSRFVDFATGEVTADVNNAATTTEQLNTGASAPYSVTVPDDFASLSAALDAINKLPYQNDHGVTLEINLPNGGSETIGDLKFSLPWVSHLRLKSGTSYTLNVQDGKKGLWPRNVPYLTLDHIAIQANDAANPHTHSVYAEHSTVEIFGNSTMTEASSIEVEGLFGSRIIIGDCQLTQGTTGAHGVAGHSGSHVNIMSHSEDQIKDYDRGVYLDRGATGVIGGRIDNCTDGGFAEDGADGKIVGSAHVTNCTNIGTSRTGGELDKEGSPTLTGTTNTTIQRGRGGLSEDGTTFFIGGPASVDDLIASSTLEDPSTFVHRGRMADDLFGFAWNDHFSQTVGGGSVTYLYDAIQMRQPGNASAKDETRIFNSSVEFDPSVSGSIRLDYSNVNLPDNGGAIIVLQITDAPNSQGLSSGDVIAVRVDGSGGVKLFNREGGTQSFDEVFQSNTFVNDLDFIKLSWDGSTSTLRYRSESTAPGSPSDLTVSGNYPSGENLFLKIAAFDKDGSNARNVDYDIDQIQFS